MNQEGRVPVISPAALLGRRDIRKIVHHVYVLMPAWEDPYDSSPSTVWSK